MTRPYRIEEPGGIFHIATRAVDERHAFGTIEDRWSFLGVLNDVVGEYGWLCKSYCLMGSHYHLIVETPRPNLSLGMQRLNGTYAQRFNGRHVRRGHLFGSRFFSVLTDNEHHLLAALRYVARNPVEAGLCARQPIGGGAVTARRSVSSRRYACLTSTVSSSLRSRNGMSPERNSPGS